MMHDLSFRLSCSLVSFLLLSCENSTPIPTIPNDKYSISASTAGKSKEPTDSINKIVREPSSRIRPDALPPNLFRAGPYWELDHYEPKAGETVGFWPGSGTYDLSTMRSKYGFSGILVEVGGYQPARDAGYSISNMMLVLHPAGWQSVIDNYDSFNYYIGEPVIHDCFGSWNSEWSTHLDLLPQIRNYANNLRGSKVVIDGFMACPHFFGAVNDADVVMYSSYRRWYWVTDTECWLVLDCSDQRDNWSAFKTYWPTKFTQTWIGGHQCPDGDMDSEIPDLAGHAHNLGLNGIWLYCGNGTTSERVELFCYWAWMKEYLRRFDREYYVWYRCTNPSGCPEDPPSPGWQYMYTWYSGVIREDIP